MTAMSGRATEVCDREWLAGILAVFGLKVFQDEGTH